GPAAEDVQDPLRPGKKVRPSGGQGESGRMSPDEASSPCRPSSDVRAMPPTPEARLARNDRRLRSEYPVGSVIVIAVRMSRARSAKGSSPLRLYHGRRAPVPC